MITIEEILKGAKLEDQTPEIQANLKELLKRVNVVRARRAKPMTVTSGLRTLEDHLRIYREKAKKAGAPFDLAKVPMKSKHLSGEAADISDPKRELQNWCLANEQVLEEAGLWCEDFQYTPNWVHFQIVPPASKKRFFIP